MYFFSTSWSDNFNVQYGNDIIRRSSQKFKIDEISAVEIFVNLKTLGIKI